MTPIDVILEAGCIATGTTPELVRSRNRDDLMSHRRRFIARKMHAEGYSWARIGRAMGGALAHDHHVDRRDDAGATAEG